MFLVATVGSRPVRAEDRAFFAVPPAVAIFPDDLPLSAGFHFAGGGAAERFTGNRDAWYAIYRLVMRRGISYNLLVSHDGERDRLRVYALDAHPFGEVRMKHELKLAGDGGIGFRPGEMRRYNVGMALPDDIPAAEVFLLLEWLPRFDKNRPMPVSLQVLTMFPGQRPGNRRLFFWESVPSPDPLPRATMAVTLPLRKPGSNQRNGWR
jgi:hypothetical protein